MLLGSHKARETWDKMKPTAMLEDVLGHVRNTPRDPLHRHLFRLVLQASDVVPAIFLPVMHPVQPAELVTALWLWLVCVPKSAFHRVIKDPEHQGHKGCPSPQG